jgi:hypothetical protein
MKIFGGNKITGGTASRAEVYGLFIAAVVLLGGGGAVAYSASGGFEAVPTPVSSETATPSGAPSETATPPSHQLPTSPPQVPQTTKATPVQILFAKVHIGTQYVPRDRLKLIGYSLRSTFMYLSSLIIRINSPLSGMVYQLSQYAFKLTMTFSNCREQSLKLF